MTLTRRAMLGLGAAVPFFSCAKKASRQTPDDEWASIRAEFELEPGVINLDNGWACSTPRKVIDSFERQMRAVARLPARELSRLYREVTRPRVVPAVAELLGVPGEELALVRNTTEAVGTVLLGYPFAPRDEVVCSSEDYWHMLEMIERRGEGGAVVRRIDLPIPAPSPDAIVNAYANAITSRTKLVLLTHASNRTGQIMPVARIAEVAHSHGAEVVVDGAQTLGVFDYRVPDLGCDYYATSMHKWMMSVPTSGALWMRRELVDKIPARFGASRTGPMDSYMSIGQVAEPAFTVLLEVIAFHARLGAARKEARLRELTRHLRDGLKTIPGIKFYTVDEPWASCGLLVFELPGREPDNVAVKLWDEHKVLVQAQAHKEVPAIRGVRVSPAIYTTFDELDRAVEAIRAVA